ncbi:restriction endonuclease subunit S [Draconibacterium orientale]|uniref:restriction endonuclease subunit S n=1 Tax=Draconibacterium orientale TaxID=1168034 RepID=UPI0029BFB6C8|nr:restriction endonuclease subunit S [Draconibacterium orientale]
MDKLPKGWEKVSLSEICTILGGGTPKTSVKDYWNGDIIWLSPTDLPEIGTISKISSSNKRITKLGLDKSSAKLLPKGSVVFSSRASIGKIGIAEIELTTNQGFTNFICSEKINNHYLCYVLKRNIAEISSLSNSTTFAEVNKSSIKSFKISLPPLHEQKRIVSKLDALFERIDKSIALLEENITQTELLVASSLDRIFDDLSKKYSEKPLLQHVDFIGGSQPPKTKFSDVQKEGFVRLIQIRDYKSDNHIVYINEKSTKKFCKADDVMIGRYGPPVFQILRGLEGAYNVALMKAVPDEKVVKKDFLFYFLQNSKIQNFIISISQRSAGQSGVNKKALEQYDIVIPPLNVQDIAITKIKDLQDKLSKLQKEQQDKLKNLKALKESILDKAFKGEL